MKDKDSDEIIVPATVEEALPNAMFRVKIKDAENHNGCLSFWKNEIHRIKVLVGDTVQVLFDPYGGKGRIVKSVYCAKLFFAQSPFY
jgi:translation initiation factor IF-1